MTNRVESRFDTVSTLSGRGRRLQPAGPASEPGGARPVGGLLAGPTSEPARARLDPSLLAKPAASRAYPSPLVCCFALSASGQPSYLIFDYLHLWRPNPFLLCRLPRT